MIITDELLCIAKPRSPKNIFGQLKQYILVFSSSIFENKVVFADSQNYPLKNDWEEIFDRDPQHFLSYIYNQEIQ